MKTYYQIQYRKTTEDDKWSEWETYSGNDYILDHSQAVAELNFLRKEYQESNDSYFRSHVFRLVKLQTNEEVLDV